MTTGSTSLTSPPPGPLLSLLRAFSILAAVAALLCGGRAIGDQRWRFSGPPRTAYLPEFQTELRTVTERLPGGARLLHLSSAPEYWYSRLWQRALYPRNETIVVQPPLSRERLLDLRQRYGVRSAISAGDPPWDPGFAWSVDLGPLPLVPGHSLFGEIAP